MTGEYTDEVVIDLVDMIFSLLKKWRSMIAVVLIGALLGGAWAMVPQEMPEKEDIKSSALVNMEKALEFRELYQQQKQYIEESLLMQMDANDLYQGSLSFHVGAEKELNMVRAEYGALLDEEVHAEIRDAAGYDVALKYIDELTGCSAYVVTDSKGDNSTATLEVTYTVTTDDESRCNAMLDVIRTRVELLQKELSRRYHDHDAVKTADTVSQITGTDYIEVQENQNKKLNDYLDSAVKLETAFSDDESWYYGVIMRGQEQEELGLGYYAKKIVVTAFLGGVLWALWFLVKYLTDSNIKTVGEAETISGLLVLGRVKAEKNLKGIDKWLDDFQEKTRNILDETSFVAAVIDSRKEGDAVLCGNRKAEEVCRIMGELSQSCAGLIPCDFTHYSASALQKAKAVGQAVLVVRTGKTKKAELLRELELCKMQNVKVLGMVVAD